MAGFMKHKSGRGVFYCATGMLMVSLEAITTYILIAGMFGGARSC